MNVRYTWQTAEMYGPDGQPSGVPVTAVLVLSDERPTAIWAPWWPGWSVSRGAIPVGSS